MMNTIRKRAALFGSVAALSLALAACSSDADTADDTASDTASDTEEMSEDMDSALTLDPVGDACSAVPTDGEGSSEGMADDPVATAASNNPLLSTLVTAVGEAGLVDTLNGLEGATVFAPVNDAFGAFTEEELNELLADTDALTNVLTLHVVPENLTLEDLEAAGTVTTVQGAELSFDFSGGELPTVSASNDATVICGNVQTANATVHLIDAVLLPSS